MNRPLLITDCDEVLLHMVRHFGDWLGEAHAIDFALGPNHNFATALTHQATGEGVAAERIWPLLDGFFATEMARQTLIPHAREALAEIAEVADIVVLTNLRDQCHAGRVAQLEVLDIRHRVVCNQGGKGTPVGRLIAEYQPSVAVFVDDLAVHHASVAEHQPQVWRLHMIGEPRLAEHSPKAPEAHARIDDWAIAKEWVLDRLRAGEPAE